MLKRPANAAGDDLGAFDRLRADIDDPDEHFLVPQLAEHAHVHPGRRAFDRHLVDAASREQRQRHAVVAPVGILRFPGNHERGAVAVTDVHRLDRLDAVHALLQRLDAPLLNLVEVNVEARLVELDHVRAGVGQLARFGVEDPGEAHRQRLPIGAVVLVGDLVGNGYRPGQRHLEAAVRQPTGDAAGVDEHGRAPFYRTDDAGHLGRFGVTAATRALPSELLRVGPGETGQEPPDVMPSRDLAVGHDVETCFFLLENGDAYRVDLRLAQLGTRQPPRRAEHVGLGEPGGFGKAADDGSGEHGARRPLSGNSRRQVNTLRVKRTAGRILSRGPSEISSVRLQISYVVSGFSRDSPHSSDVVSGFSRTFSMRSLNPAAGMPAALVRLRKLMWLRENASTGTERENRALELNIQRGELVSLAKATLVKLEDDG